MQPSFTEEDLKITQRDFDMPRWGAASVIQVGNYLGISPAGVRRLVELEPTFPKPRKVLRSVRWNATDVIAWFESREETTNLK
jgi:predicted DNA-binding transcriptional regulator AlpA